MISRIDRRDVPIKVCCHEGDVGIADGHHATMQTFEMIMNRVPSA